MFNNNILFLLLYIFEIFILIFILKRIKKNKKKNKLSIAIIILLIIILSSFLISSLKDIFLKKEAESISLVSKYDCEESNSLVQLVCTTNTNSKYIYYRGSYLNGEVHENEIYDENGNYLGKFSYSYITEIDKLQINGRYTYDHNNELIYHVTYINNYNGNIKNSRTIERYGYDDKGNSYLIKREEYDFNEVGDMYLDSVYVPFKDEEGNLLREIKSSYRSGVLQRTVEYFYDNEQLKRQVYTYYTKYGGKYQFHHETIYNDKQTIFNSYEKDELQYTVESQFNDNDVLLYKNLIIVNMREIENMSFYELSFTSVKIPDGVTTIGSNAFSDNNLTSIIIPKSVTSIGKSAFAGNDLTSIIIEGDQSRFDDSWVEIGFPVDLMNSN